ncbi:MAG: hypothetical protein IPP13_17120 [Kouleothrix sp.]|jgi:hypothetical protein|nr:hypothetical protein [Kouleothrix sp.]
MNPQEIATIQFVDAESGEEMLAIIQVSSNSVALCLSQKTNGDLEVFLSPVDCNTLITALQQALSSID